MSGAKFTFKFKGKNVILSEIDVNRSRLASLFKIIPDTVYIIDDGDNAFFPDQNGDFDTFKMNQFAIFNVDGDPLNTSITGSSSNQGQYKPSTSAYVTFPRPTQNRHIPVPLRQKNEKKNEIRRVILLADFDDDDYKPVVIGTAYIQIDEKSANPEAIANLVKEYNNTNEDYTICDINGFEILSSPGTTGIDFWKIPSKKFLAVPIGRYFSVSKQREARAGKKRKRSSTSTVTSEEMEETMKNVLEPTMTSISKTNSLIEEKFLDFEFHFDEGVKASQIDIQKDLSDIKSLLSNITNRDENDPLQSLKTALTCKICQRISKKEIAFAQCCGQIIGCCECINRWFEEEDTCPLCRNIEGVNKVIPFRGLDQVIQKLQ